MTDQLTEHVGFDMRNMVATLELRRPEKRNAVTMQMWQAMIAHLSVAATDPEVRVLVLQGRGGVFSAGADLAEVKGPDGTASSQYSELAERALSAIATFPAPSVARIEGSCIGGGCSLALACDFRFAHPSATFSIPAVRHGIVYPRSSVDRLAALLGPSSAAWLMFTAESVDAARAADIGLVDECASDLDSVFGRFVDAVASGRRDTIAATRRLLRPTDFRIEPGTAAAETSR